MILYATPVSSYSAKVRIVLATKGIAYEEQLPPGGYRSDSYRAIVPMGTLPAIRIGDWVLSESEVINEFLEENWPQPAMMPTDPRARAQVRFLCRFHDLYLEPPVRALFAQVRPAQRDAGQVETLRADIERRVAQLAAWVRPDPWLLSPSISLADCGFLVDLPLACVLLQTCGRPIQLPPVLQQWLDMAQQVPAVRRVLDPWRGAVSEWLQATGA